MTDKPASLPASQEPRDQDGQSLAAQNNAALTPVPVVAAPQRSDDDTVYDLSERIRQKIYDLWVNSRKSSRTDFGQASFQTFVRQAIFDELVKFRAAATTPSPVSREPLAKPMSKSELADYLDCPVPIRDLWNRLVELEQHVGTHDLKEFEPCEICREGGEYDTVRRQYEKAAIEYVDGMMQNNRPEQCPNCGGDGYFTVSVEMATDAGYPNMVGSRETCGRCKGDGVILPVVSREPISAEQFFKKWRESAHETLGIEITPNNELITLGGPIMLEFAEAYAHSLTTHGEVSQSAPYKPEGDIFWDDSDTEVRYVPLSNEKCRASECYGITDSNGLCPACGRVSVAAQVVESGEVFVAEPHPGPSCHVCGATMEYVCPSCGASTKPTMGPSQ